MKKSSKCYLTAIMLTGLLFTLPGDLASAEHKSDALPSPSHASLIVVRTSAQWCAVCVSAKTSFSNLKSQLSAKPILFVTLDRTDEASTRQAVYLAKALDIDEQLFDGLGEVGDLAIINTQSKRVINKTRLSKNVSTMSQMINKALASAHKSTSHKND